MKKKATARTARRKAEPTKKAAARTTKKAGKKAAARPGPRADLGAPVDGFFLKQPPALRAILSELRQLVELEVPRAESAIKWGNPFYTLDGATISALCTHKSHVNL